MTIPVPVTVWMMGPLPLKRKSKTTGAACGASGKPKPRAQIIVPISDHAPQKAVREIEKQDNDVQRGEIGFE